MISGRYQDDADRFLLNPSLLNNAPCFFFFRKLHNRVIKL